MTIPLTVIGGFLGAGKTTLVNHLLRTAERRWAVLVNDFGAVNIDAALITARDGDTISLANGCVCCSTGDDLGAALNRLATRDPMPEHVIVEASGVGDPWRIAQLALIEPGFSLEPLVVMIDATGFAAHLADPWVADTIRLQLRHAELLLLNKTDLTEVAERDRIRHLLHALRPEANVLEVAHAAVPAAALSFPVAAHSRARPSRLHAEHITHPFTTWHWQPQAMLDRDRLRVVLDGLPASVLRIKGICRFAPDGHTQLLQYAAERWAFTDMPDAPPTGLVVIGTPALPDAAALRRMFEVALPLRAKTASASF